MQKCKLEVLPKSILFDKTNSRLVCCGTRQRDCGGHPVSNPAPHVGGAMTSRQVCCTIDYNKIKRNMDRWRDEILETKRMDATGGIYTVPVEAVVRKIDEGIEEATFPLLPGNFVLRADEQAEPVYYGKGTAPQPLDIFLAGIGMCMASIYGEAAADLKLKIDSVEVGVRGDLDMEGIFDLSGDGYGARPGFSKIGYTVRVESSEPSENIRMLMNLVERRCPAHNTVMHGTHGVFNYFLNGEKFSIGPAA